MSDTFDGAAPSSDGIWTDEAEWDLSEFADVDVDDVPDLAAQLDQLVDRVDGGSGNVVDNRPIFPRSVCSSVSSCPHWACPPTQLGADHP